MHVRNCLLVVQAALLFSGRAEAQRAVDAELFHPAMDGFGILSVERAETSPKWDFGFGFFFNYAHNPLRLSLYDDTIAKARTQTVMTRQFGFDFGAHLGLTSWLEAAVDIPLSAQTYGDAYGHPASAADTSATRTGFYAGEPYTNVSPPDAAPLDSRLSLKARLFRKRGFAVAAQALVTLPFGDEAAFLGSNGFSFSPLLVGDFTHGGLRLAVNFGAVVRASTRILDPHDVAANLTSPRLVLELGHEISWAAAIAYRFSRFVGAAAEITGLTPVGLSSGARADHTADVLGGLQIFPGHDLAISVGGGAGVIVSAARRDLFRTFAGITWTPESR